MKKKGISILLACVLALSTAACGSSDTAGGQQENSSSVQEAVSEAVSEAESSGEMTDGKFNETRTITVEVYDRGNDGGSDPTNNNWTNYIKEGMLEEYNVQVEFVSVSRWTEVEEINNLLAAGDAPDICVTYDYSTIKTYADMGGVVDLSSALEEYKDMLPNLWDWLGETYLYWDQDPETGSLWAIEGRMAASNNLNTFIRKDWLDTLGLEAPETTQEFYEMLCAFRDNAEVLLGDDAANIIPFFLSEDVGWYARPLIMSFIDPDITDYDYYVHGFDDRFFTMDGTKEAIRLLNQWYNEDLIWKDFVLVDAETGEDYIKSGYVGAFCQNWDTPYRNGDDSYQRNLERIVGEDAEFIAVNCFEDKNGNYSYYSGGEIDRKVFFPTTNTEILASLLYLDWITDPEHVEYLQIGEEGITHNLLESGAVETITATGDWIQNSGYNIDYTLTVNGLKLVDEEQTALSTAYSYGGGDPEQVEQANQNSLLYPARVVGPVNVGTIQAESGVGTALNEKRTMVFDQAVVASVEDFDSVWDAGMADYMSSGGQAIQDERAEKWAQYYGDAVMLADVE